MEVREGYKQTDIGVIPNDWEVCTFADIANKSIKRSITGGPFGSNLKATDYTDNGVQIIQLQNIGDGDFNESYSIYTSIKKANELISCNIYPGEIILSKMGDPVARACFIPNSEKRYLMASDGIRLVVNEKDFSKKFIHDYINSIYFRRRAFEVSSGSTRLRIGLPELKGLLVIKPRLKEQIAIAEIFSDTDALITSLEKLIEKKRAIKQGAMQQLLKPKPGWVVKKLGEVATIQRGASPRPIDSPVWFDENSKVGWVRISDVTNSIKFLVETTQKLSDQGINNSRYVKEGELIMSICATIGRPILTTFDVCIHDGFVAFYNPQIDKEFLYYYLTFIEGEWTKSGQTGSQMNLNSDIINSKILAFPGNLVEQKSIAATLSALDSNIFLLEKNLTKYKMLKQGMMQELLTGKTRLV